MVSVIDMKDIRYLNLFRNITNINTRYCLHYNNSLIFAVPKNSVSRAIGKNGTNVKKLSEILGRKIKIIPNPKGIEDLRSFVENIVNPVMFKDIEIVENEIVLTAGSQNKASLIGRDKKRLLELKLILKDYFKKDLKII